ncbi:MAG: GntP family permease [Planctomycetota bacterium]
MSPLAILAVGVAVVLGLILVLRLNPFLALVAAALAVSFLAPGELTSKVSRVAEAFGVTAGKIGIPIAMAAVIGGCLLASGAADRIVQAALKLVGEKRSAAALAGSGFVLSIPVFFDTVFYLLVPLARSLHHRTGRHYLRYLLAIGAGGAIAHTLIPPTPGPLIAADQLGVELGTMMLIGVAVGGPSAAVALWFAGWLDRVVRLANPPQRLQHSQNETDAQAESALPGLFVAALPIMLPVVLISGRTILDRMARNADQESFVTQLADYAAVFGDANLALILAATIALGVYVVHRQPARSELTKLIEEALMSAGVIILITSAGGAFGAMLKVARIGEAVQGVFADSSASSLSLLFLAFGLSSLLKVSQGSGTVAVITASTMVAAMIEGQTLQYNPAYLASAIGCGALCGVWMNDSGFWIFCRMGGLTETEGLKTWTPILAVTGVVGMAMTCALAKVMPLAVASESVLP